MTFTVSANGKTTCLRAGIVTFVFKDTRFFPRQQNMVFTS